MSSKIIIGYSTQLANLDASMMPQFKAPSNYKDESKIAAYIEESKQNFILNAKDAPYTGTFKQVFMLDPSNKKVAQFDNYDDPNKQPICVRVRNYLIKSYPSGWNENTYDSRNPPFRFLGFNIRRFLKMLGLECSLPSINKPLPLKMWYSNSEHRDIIEAILPHEFDKQLDLQLVLKYRRPLKPENSERWDTMLSGWEGPHINPQKDAWLTVELATQLGFLE